MRRQPRAGTIVECRKGTLGLGQDIAVGIVDFSEDGVLIIVREPLNVGDEIEIGLMPPGFGRPRKFEATVVRVAGVPGVGYQVAAAFSSPLNYVDLYHLT
jgi:hypothetical protein